MTARTQVTAPRVSPADSYERLLQTLTQMKSCLASVNPFVFTVYESFVSSSVARTGKAIMPLPRDRIAGGQTVCAVGYDRTHSRFI